MIEFEKNLVYRGVNWIKVGNQIAKEKYDE